LVSLDSPSSLAFSLATTWRNVNDPQGKPDNPSSSPISFGSGMLYEVAAWDKFSVSRSSWSFASLALSPMQVRIC